MSATRSDEVVPGRTDRGALQSSDRTRRLSTETKASYKTTELVVYLVVLAGILISAASISGTGANVDAFGGRSAWLYATILTVGYMVSRGLAKAGSREPYDEERS